MNIAYTMSPGAGDMDEMLADLAKKLTASGLCTCGVVQINTGKANGQQPCDMDVMILPDGPIIRISQSLGPEAKGCRLDASALENAVGEVMARLNNGADVLLLNKFGKHEADGRGFRSVIGDALSQDIPVITGVNKHNLDAFMAFTDGFATEVSPGVEALSAWLNSVSKQSVIAQ